MIDVLLLLLLPLGPVALCVAIGRRSLSGRRRAILTAFAFLHPLTVGWLGWHVGAGMPQDREAILQPTGGLAIMMFSISVLASLIAVPIGLGISTWLRRRAALTPPPTGGFPIQRRD